MCLGLRVGEVERAPKEIDAFGSLDRCVEEILKACEQVNGVLAPLLSIEIDGVKNIYTHTELQIASIVASFFRSRNGLEPQKSFPLAKRGTRLVHHYLSDALRREWAGTGDTKAYRAVSMDRYAEEVPRRTFEAQAESFYLDAPENRNGAVRRDPALVAFLRAVTAAKLGKSDREPVSVAPIPTISGLKLIGIDPMTVANLSLLRNNSKIDPGGMLPPLPAEPTEGQIKQRLDDRFEAMVDLICSHFSFGS
jgi:hypothetical protein